MDGQVQELRPNYKKIYWDLIVRKIPERLNEFENYFVKKQLSVLDIIKLNNKLFSCPDRKTKEFNGRHLSYDKNTIKEILDYQVKYSLNNSQMEREFNISRNTIAKWKKMTNI